MSWDDGGVTRADLRCLAAIGAVLVVADVVLILDSLLITIPVAIVATLLVIALARRNGLDSEGFGLSAGTTGRGVRWAALAVLLVGLAVFVFAALPWSSPVLDDDKTPESLAVVLATVGFVIPVRTVLLEEIAFRGALWGLLERRLGHVKATVWSSLAFGFWHVPDALRLARENAAIEAAAGSSSWAVIPLIALVVAVTGLAGVVFCELRRRSGSLLAAIGLHWAANSATTVASFVVAP